MPLPGDLATITVTGSYPGGDGGARTGTVTFTPSTDLVDATGHAIIRAAPIICPLYAGTFSIALLCTDNANISPSGWYWNVTEAVDGATARTYSVLIPHSGSTVDLSTLAPVSPGPAVSTLYGVLATGNTNTWHSAQIFDGTTDIEGGLTFGGVSITNPPNDATKVLSGAGTWISPGGATGALLAANNLSDLANASTARNNLGLGSAATSNTSAFDAAGAATAAQNASLQKASNLSDLANAGTARTNLGLGSAAILNVGTATGTVAAGDDSRITGALQRTGGTMAGAIAMGSNKVTGLANGTAAGDAAAFGQVPTSASSIGGLLAANNLSDVGNASTARTNLALGTQAQQNAGTITGAMVEVLPTYACAASGGSTLTAAVLILNLVRPLGPITVTNIGIWLTTAGVTSSGANGLALYTEAGVLIDQTADLSTAFASTGYTEAALSLGPQTLSANTSYYIGVLSHFSGTAPKAAAALAGQVVPVIKGHYASLTKSSTATFPSSFTPSTYTTSTAAYYMTLT